MDNDIKNEVYVCYVFTQYLNGIETTNLLINPTKSDPRVRYAYD